MENKYTIKYLGIKDFTKEQIKFIALKYANTPYNYSSTSIAIEFSRDDEYVVKSRTIMNIIHKAIKEYIVPTSVAKKIKKKAMYNSRLHSKASSLNVAKKYDSLIREGIEFKNNGYRKVKTKRQNYENEDVSEEEFIEMKRNELKNLKLKLTSINFKLENFEEFFIDEDDQSVDLQKNQLLREKAKLEKDIFQLARQINT